LSGRTFEATLHIMRALGLVALAIAVAACSATNGSDELAPSMTHTFDAIDIAENAEASGVCQSWTLDNDESMFVSKVRQRNDGGWHHSNWFFVPEDVFPGPDGTWDCEERGFDTVSAGISGGVFFAQSTQALSELQEFPTGAALEIPPRYKLVGDVHLVNISGRALSTSLTFDIETMDEEDVAIRLSPIAFTNTALDIEPQAESRYAMTCNVESASTYNIYYVLPHYHEWGNYFRLSFVGEDGSERTIFEQATGVGEPLGAVIDPPISSEGAPGLRVECGYYNNTDRRLQYGLGGQEMCVFLAYSDADVTLAATSLINDAQGPDEDGVYQNETLCSPVLAAPRP
jgi:hypothetical protein